MGCRGSRKGQKRGWNLKEQDAVKRLLNKMGTVSHM